MKWPKSSTGSRPSPATEFGGADDKWDGKPADGGFQAMDQMANWVRFADTKATILTAGLGVILTMLITNAKTVTAAIGKGSIQAFVVGPLALGALAAFLWTLYWLVRAIGPQTATRYAQLNRFAWPALQAVTAEQMIEHTKRVDVRMDAWQQVLDLSHLAGRKFEACSMAVKGFALLAILGLLCVAISMGLTA
ncbi:hypothetical protein [Arthrobacter sp. NicSoilC5]|uniref:hypothetical protein n=1 Tax=Arthrobacter sp. NicSoilC5 TaxID=2831000 RepID=UPI001CC79923|nr:hypothetical protein [Arthrobacter sp. NicSoilC5]BCW78908.1 hypothetical protein NicSoilC5_09270 [Arthrobacter sp. NicSoilC5]